MLKSFVATGKKCEWSGCDNSAYKTTLPVKGKTIHCIKHHLKKHSGRVGPNYIRDFYRENLKPACELSGVKWCEEFRATKMMSEKLGMSLSKVQLIRRTCQAFDVDHIDGNHYNNDRSNLQTLTKRAHKLKTDIMGDCVNVRFRT